MRKLIFSTMLAASGLLGCDDGGGGGGGETPDGGPGDASAEPEAPFNYIPLNDESCDVETQPPGVQQAAGEAIQALVAGGEHRIAKGLKLCDEAAIAGCDFTCTGAENPMMQLARDFDGPLPQVVVDASGFDVPMGLSSFFDQALSWPYRELVFSYVECDSLPAGSCPPGMDTQVVLSQGRQQRCDGQTAGCDLFSIEPESLDLTCNRFPLTLFSPVEGDLAAEYGLTANLPQQAIDSGVTFNLAIPLVTDFPAAGANLSEDELLAWLDRLNAAQRNLALRVENFGVEIRKGANGEVCGRSTGKVPLSAFVEALGVEDPDRIQLIEGIFSPYGDADDNTKISAQFVFKLEPARMTNGMPCHPDPCVTTENMCDGDTLMTRTTRDRCFVSADGGADHTVALEPTCVERTAERVIDWSIDCAALGSTCSAATGCGVEYETPTVGDLVFTELFIGNGVGTSYDEGGANTIDDQWIELYNASDNVLDIDSCVIRSGPITAPRIAVLQPGGPVAVGPGERIVLAHSGDPATHGLSNVAHAYGFPIGLGRGMGADRIAIYCGENQLIDEVTWADDWGINEDTASMQLDASVLTAAGNDGEDAWCESAGDEFTAGRVGTPGAPNTACP